MEPSEIYPTAYKSPATLVIITDVEFVTAAVSVLGLSAIPDQYTPYVPGMNRVVIVLFCLIPMAAWAAALIAMRGYTLTGQRMKTIQAVNAARKEAVARGMTLEEAMTAITDGTVERP